MLSKTLYQHQDTIENWLQSMGKTLVPLFNCSIDIRNAGFKIASIDANLFPAGFNNLSPDIYPDATAIIKQTMDQLYPACKKILVVAESHTRNLRYYQSLKVLYDLLEKAGFDVKVGSFLDINKETTIENITLYPMPQSADLILLNNDLSNGTPPLLQHIERPIEPPLQLGWQARSKFDHFNHYKTLCEILAKLINIDPWLIYPFTDNCGKIDFIANSGIECLADHTSHILNECQKKYDEYKINANPFVVIKADNGTYGMAVMSIYNPKELYQLNRKQRTQMATIKSGIKVNRVLIQEGIFAQEKVGPLQSVAEPVIYLIGHHVIGGFYRANTSRKNTENLNSPGMHFEPLEMNEHYYAYTVIARIAALANAMEKAKVDPMTVKLLVIMDPIDKIHIEKDTTFALLVEAQKRNWQIYYAEPQDLFLLDGKVYGLIKKIALLEYEIPWYHYLTPPQKTPLNEFDIVLMRQDPPFDLNYLYTTYLLDIAVKTGCYVMNPPQAVRDANEKLFATHFPQCCPPTLVTSHQDLFLDFLEEHHKIVIKPLNYMGGKGIFVLEKGHPNLYSAFELLTQNGQVPVMIQRYLPEIVAGDKRILLIQGKPYPYAIARIPKRGDFRGNLAAGATAIKHIPTERDLWLCEQIGPTLIEKRLFFVGIDVIGNYITEINVTSPTCVREIEKLFQVNVSEAIIDVLWEGKRHA